MPHMGTSKELPGGSEGHDSRLLANIDNMRLIVMRSLKDFLTLRFKPQPDYYWGSR